jgi:hypothetical protein
VEDLLNFFSEEKIPSMTGAVKLRAHVNLPAGDGFLKKVQLTGDFGVAGESLPALCGSNPLTT